MHGGPVVPQDDIPWPPPVPIFRLRRFGDSHHLGQKRLTFRFVHSFEAPDPNVGQEQSRPPGFRMGADCRVHDHRRFRLLLGGQRATDFGHAPVIAPGVVVDGIQTQKPPPQGIRQSVESRRHADKRSFAAVIRTFDAAEDRSKAWFGQIGEIGMVLRGAAMGADVPAVLDDVGHHENFRMPRQKKLGQHMLFKRAEAAGKGDVVVRGDVVLPADQGHSGLGESTADKGEVIVRDGLRKVQPQDFHAELRMQRLGGQSGHLVIPCLRSTGIAATALPPGLHQCPDRFRPVEPVDFRDGFRRLFRADHGIGAGMELGDQLGVLARQVGIRDAGIP